jgi:hypothetical protein
VIGLAGVLAGCVTDPDRLDTGDIMGAESGATTAYTDCQAKARQATDERNAQIALTLCWLDENSEYRKLGPPAYWVELPKDEMAAMGQRRLNRNASAAYFCSDKTMYMTQGWDWRDLGVRSVLVHELVHYGQCVAGRMSQTRQNFESESCENEREALTLQAKFLRQAADRLPTARERNVYREFAERTIKRGDEVCYGGAKR